MDVPKKDKKQELIGRSAEIAEIESAIDQLQTGVGQVVLISGEPGIGKSTLARQIDQFAATRGIPTSWGFAWEAGGAPAYWPWTQLLRAILKKRTIDEGLAPMLGQILPEYNREPQKNLHLQPEQARFQLLESVRELLEQASLDQPMVLILDDLHVADSDSLHMLHYLSRHIRSMPILLVGIFRDVEARQSSSSEPLWRTARDARMLQLSPLSRDDIVEFVSKKTGTEPLDDQVQELLATTEGNPLFLNELVGLRAHVDANPDDRLPESIQQVIRQQLDRLRTETRQILGTASVLGRQFSNQALAGLSGNDYEQTRALLEPAIESGIIRSVDRENNRFAHLLHRDVLHQDLDRTFREELHRNRATRMQEKIQAGEVDRWSELATHLDAAGPDHRNEAIDAWRHAAARASERFAFDDAASSLQKALDTFGHGPKFAPATRAQLMLDLASATLAKGDVEQGQALCRDAFDIAKTIDDRALMALAALTYGSVIVVAKVDQTLIGLLQESLELLPPDAISTRAKVSARLAAAQQPSLDPGEPVKMAFDAIALARTTNDQYVVYEVLKSAISAIMDFVSAADRLPLNREAAQLAAKFGDVAGQFRSNLRIMIDTSELCDRDAMDEAINACERIADKVRLPHYQWRVASARAMQATIDGNFAKATDYLNDAEVLAEKIGDASAYITLAIQRFTILYDWASPGAASLEAIEKQLQKAYANGFQEAEFYIQPFMAAYTRKGDRSVAARVVSNQALIDRTFSGGDRYTLGRMGESALLAEDHELAERCYDALLPSKNLCATLGLMGSAWSEPVAYTLGKLARGLHHPEIARQHFDLALEVCERMRARPMTARVSNAVAALEREQGNTAAEKRFRERADLIIDDLELRPTRSVTSNKSAASVTPPKSDEHFSMQLQGDIWTVAYGSQVALIKNSKGLVMLDKLISRPEHEIHVLELVGSQSAPDTSGAVPILDNLARQDYKRRIRDIEEELADAEDFADAARTDSLRSELDFITTELSRAFGLDGRGRQTGSAAERARVNARRRLSDAIKRIGKELPEAGRYLKNTIKTGSYCQYAPM